MINVIKATGEREEFNKDKIIESIKRLGIPLGLQDKILMHVEQNIYENIPTFEIYDHITEFLGKAEPFLKTKYGLKQAIMDLGPTGYPFEDYVSEIFKISGYFTEVRSLLNGKCVTHEIDIIAETINSPKKRVMVEAKFHNTPGIKTDLHVALYTKARFDDIKDNHNLDNAVLVTNTKITTDALAYAMCSGIDVLSWSYPHNNSLRDLIEKNKLYPLTILQTLTNTQKSQLLDAHVTLLKDLVTKPQELDILLLADELKAKIIEEAKLIYG